MSFGIQVPNIKQYNLTELKQMVANQVDSSCVHVLYLLFAELPYRQDVLAHQRVEQRRGLDMRHLSSR